MGRQTFIQIKSSSSTSIEIRIEGKTGNGERKKKKKRGIDKLLILLYTIMLFFFEDFLFGEATKQEKGGYHTHI